MTALDVLQLVAGDRRRRVVREEATGHFRVLEDHELRTPEDVTLDGFTAVMVLEEVDRMPDPLRKFLDVLPLRDAIAQAYHVRRRRLAGEEGATS